MRTPPLPNASRQTARRERGAVLVVGLVLLLVLTLAGVVLARMQTTEERMSRNEANHQLALQAAEAALRDAETNLNNGTYQALGFAGTSPGLYTLIPGDPSVADTLYAANWSAAAMAANPTLAYAGPALSAVPMPAAPQFIIEELPAVASGSESLNAQKYSPSSAPPDTYRITVRAWGGDNTATATLESVFQ